MYKETSKFVVLDVRNQYSLVIWGVVLLFLAGFSIRLALLFIKGIGDLVMVEPTNVALSLASYGTYADAYGPHVGPTGHCMPLHPFFIAMLIKLFGTGHLASFFVSWSACAASAGGYALLPVLALSCRLPVSTGLIAGCVGALMPVNYWFQAFGVFDAPFTFLALILLCCLISYFWTRKLFSMRNGFLAGILIGLTCLLNAATFPVLFVWFGLGLMLYQEERRHFLKFLAGASLATILVLTPWTIRNYIVFRSLIVTRTNFGLELMVSNNNFMTADLEKNIGLDAFKLFHPFFSSAERDKVHKWGEVVYNLQKKQEALQWIRSHPKTFLRLSANRIFLFWFPHMRRIWQTIFEGSISILGIGGSVVLLLKRKYIVGLLLGTAIVIYPLVYYVIQVSPRYRFPIEGLLLFLATVAVCDGVKRFTRVGV